MTTRKIIDIEHNGEKVWPKGHAKATFMSSGSTVEDAINRIGTNGKDGADGATFRGRTTKGWQTLRMMVTYEDKPWRVRQTHTPLEIYPPSMATASLYEAIDKEHSGEADDPIPYAPPMEIFVGKHYVEDGVVYRCTRNSGVALSHRLADLVGLYVEEVK